MPPTDPGPPEPNPPDARPILPWPTDFVWGEPVPPPEHWRRPGLVMLFNLECPGCISRGIPFLKRLLREHDDRFEVLAIHTSYGRRAYAREQVVPQLVHFAADHARLPFAVALDLDGDLARDLGAEGTPHWLVFAPGGRLLRSIYGSQDNARTRLEYLLAELAAEPADTAGPPPDPTP